MKKSEQAKALNNDPQRTLEGANHLAVATDKIQEVSTVTVSRRAALMTADCYRRAADLFVMRARGEPMPQQLWSAREAIDAYKCAADYYRRSPHHSRRRARALELAQDLQDGISISRLSATEKESGDK